ncbi:MAG: hypothetical protein Q9178_004271 [Gyalolechia marmorata]
MSSGQNNQKQYGYGVESSSSQATPRTNQCSSSNTTNKTSKSVASGSAGSPSKRDDPDLKQFQQEVQAKGAGRNTTSSQMPENCLMGMEKHGNQVYVTDLGLATERRTAQAKENPDRALNPKLVGTARFASVNGDFGVGYMLLYNYFLRCLPWQGLTATYQEQKEKLILAKKQTISTEELFEGLPQIFATDFDQVRARGSDAKPQYSYLRRNFRSLFVRQGFDHDYVFDWMTNGPRRARVSCRKELYT